MAALVVGTDLGLGNSSLHTLGLSQGSAAQGQAGDGVYVNLGTGNLVLQQQDELLLGLGLPSSTLRTYNSQGLFDGDNNDNWRIGFYRQLGDLSGVFGTANSSITRTAADGASERYVWDVSGAIYLNRDGAGAYRSLARQANGSWLWQDGSGASETYQSIAGSRALLREQRAANGVVTDFQYASNGLLGRVLGANGEFTELVYDSTPGRQSNLLMLRTGTRESATGPIKLQTRVRYAYDDLNRLAQVTVDLSPQDNAIADGRVVTTRYSYEGASHRLSTMMQSDGANFTFGYDELERVVAVTDALGALTRYDYGPGHATVIHPLGQFTTYGLDGMKRLTRIDTHSGTSVESRRFEYNAQGDVGRVVEADGAVTQFEYDALGNLALRRDAQGEVSMRYNAQNQLLSETRQPVGRPDAALVTRYVYDPSGLRLRFVISAEGRVTQYRYNGLAMRESSVAYAGRIWLGTDLPDEAAMVAWVAGMTDPSQALRTDYGYDFRGQLASSTDYTQLDSAGDGLAQTGATTRYVYDAAGRLLQTIAPETGAVSSQVYDALGRVLLRTNALGQSSSFLYLEQGDSLVSGSASRIVHTAADGSISSTVFDASGRMVASIVGQGAATAITRYSYDANNRLRRRTDATGVHDWTFYDALGRKTGQLDGNGGWSEYRYDAVGRLVQTIRYAQVVRPERMNALLSRLPELDEVRPPADAQHDQVDWMFYDAAGRPSKSIDAEGAVTENFYDEAGRLQSLRRYANTLNTATLDTHTRAEDITVASDAALDRITRYFHDRDGLLRATLDAEGYLTEILYDGAGRAWQTVAYALASAAPGGSDLQQVRPPASTVDIRRFSLFDARGQVSGEIDGEGYLTEVSHDANGNRILSTRYATPLPPSLLAGLNSTTPVSSLRPALSAQDQRSTVSYDALNRLLQAGNAEGTQTRYVYDVLGRRIASTAAWGSDEARTRLQRFDSQGLLLAELDGEGGAALSALGSAASATQIQSVWDRYGTRYSYDLAGRRIAKVDANGNATRYYYDQQGKLRYTVDALGQVQGSRYDSFGQLIAQTRYAASFGASELATLKGGVLDAAMESRFGSLAVFDQDSSQTWIYNQDGSLAATFDGLLNSTEYRYNGFGERVSSTQWLEPGKSVINTVDYDRRGLQRQATADARGINSTTTVQYDAFGRVVAVTDATGRISRNDYDRLGRQVASIEPLNVHRLTNYDAFGRILRQVDGTGAVTTTQYDDFLRSATVTTPEGIRFSTWRNRHGETVQVVDGRGNSSRYRYDHDGRLLETTDAQGALSSERYDQTGNHILHTDARGTATLTRYDAAGRVLTRTVDPGGLDLTTRHVYDAKGQVLKTIAPDGAVTLTRYDRRGQVLSVTRDADGLKLHSTYTWDARGLMLSVTEGAGSPVATTTAYTYDALGRRITETVDPDGLNLVTRYIWNAAGQLEKTIDPARQVTRNLYDAVGRLEARLDPMGALTVWRHDAEGRQTVELGYSQLVDLDRLPDAPTLPEVMNQLENVSPTKVERTVYDRDGRAIFQIDALAQVTHNEYDGNGNLVRQTRYAKPVLVGLELQVNTVEAALAAVSGSEDRVTRMVYDASNRLVYSISALDTVTAYQRDAAGNVVQEIAYANSVSIPGLPGASEVRSAMLAKAAPALDRQTTYVLDAAGRNAYVVDALGYVVARGFDAGGRIVRTIRHANPIALTEIPSLGTLKSLLAASTAPAVVETQTWDAAGRLVDSTDGLGVVTHRDYDAAGRLTDLVLAYGRSAAVRTHYGYDRAGNLILRSEAAGSAEVATTFYRYDALGKVVTEIHALGVELADQDTPWALEQRKAYGVVDASGQARLAATLSAVDREALYACYSTRREYDAMGRVVLEIDHQGGVTRRQYDAYGNLIVLTDPRRNSGSFAYDALDRVVSHANPLGQITSTTYAVGGEVESTSTQGAATTAYRYDKLDRLLQTTDAEGYVESQTWDALGNRASFTNKLGGKTVFTFDQLGRKLTETLPVTADTGSGMIAVVNRYAWDGQGNLISSTEAVDLPEQRLTTYEYDAGKRLLKKSVDYNSGRTLVEARSYDDRGNLIESQDANGQRSLSWYDARNRKIAELGADGALSQWRYNAGEQALAKVVYGDALALPATAATQPMPVNAANRRETLYEYDRDHRLTATILRNQTIGRYNGSNGQYELSTGDLMTRQVYDDCGNVVQVIDAHGNATRTWYDAMGQKILLVDTEGYGTAWRYDGNGQVVAQTRFAHRNAQSLENLDGATLAAAWPTSAEDRITNFRYDRNGRLLEERQGAVFHGKLDAGGGLTGASSEVITSYAWNGLGLITQKVIANGEVSDFGYDLAGRMVREQGAAFVDFEGTAVRPTTDIEYDGLGNVRQSSRRGKSDAAITDDQINHYTYGLGGRLLTEIDAMGVATDYEYDAAGNVIRKQRQRVSADGVRVLDITRYRYDPHGREIEQTDVGTGTSQQIRYNTYGEVVARGTNGGWQQFVEYDAAGRVIKTNTEDGVTRAFAHDAAGNATLKIESSALDLRAMTLAQMLQAAHAQVPGDEGLHLTISAYDTRNQLTDSWQPEMVTSRSGAELQSSSAGVRVESGSMAGVTVTAAGSKVDVAPSGVTGKTEAGQGIAVQIPSGNVTLSASYRVGRVGWGSVGPIIGTASVYLSLPAAADIWGSGNFRVEVQSINLTNGAVTATTIHLAADARIALIAELTVAGAAGHRVSASVYKALGNGSVLLSSLSLGVPLSLTAPPPVSAGLPKLALMRPATGKAVSVFLYYRASGSSAAFQSLAIPAAAANGGPVNDTFALDWGAFARGSYELRLLAVGTDGAVEDFQSGSMTIGDSASFNLAPVSYGPAVAASMVFESANLLQLTAQGSSANSMVVHYRVAGSNALWNSTTVLKPSSASGATMPGWFTWSFGQLSGDYEVIFESHRGAKGDGDLINKIYTTLRLSGASPSVLVQPVAYQNRPSTLHFSGNPVAATSLVVRYRIQGSGSAWDVRYLVPSYTGSGTFGWDASDMVPYDQSSFVYEFEYVATDASGLLVNKGGGTLRMGAAAAVLSQYVAPPSTLLRFTPQTSAASMRLYYRPRNSSSNYAGPITLMRAADGSYGWDAAALKPAIGTADFEYFYELLDAQAQTLGRTSGYFSLGTVNSANALQWVINGVSHGANVIHHQQKTNAFGEIVQEVDGLGRATDFIYDTLGLLAQKLQTATSATLENGYVQTLRPETRYAYDLAGRAIATRDANLMLATQAWLAGGYNKLSLVRQADGSIAQYSYDVFGNLRSARDALGRITTYEYDKNNRLVSLTRPMRDPASPSALPGPSVERYEYDQAGNRIAHVNALGYRERTDYDSLGRVTRTHSFEGRSTTYDYRYAAALSGVGNLQPGGFIKTTTDANGRTLVDSTDLFGRTLAHQDLGGRIFSYRYNHAGWLVEQTGTSGQSINYEYYANGLLRGIRDLAAHTLSTYEYDAAGNRTFEGYALLKQDNQTVLDFAQQARIEYDADRVKRITDPRYIIEYEYDAAGNRRHMLAKYHDGVNGSVQTQDYWYAYDAVNRFTTTMGSLSGARATSANDSSVSILRGKDGVQIAYDLAGQRRQAIYQDANGVARTERYTYTADGYLEETSIDKVLRARRESDAAGRVLRYSENNPAGVLSFQRTSSYDSDSLVKRETTLNGASTDYYRLADGTLSSTASVDAGTTTNTWYSYEWWDSAKQSTITSQPQNAGAPGWAAGISHLLYDANGHLKEARDEAGKTGFRYLSNAQGLIMTREEYMPNAMRLQKYYYLDGQRVGDVGNGGPSRMDYVQSLAQGGQSKTGARSFTPISSADFDQNYEPINGGYPGATASTYVVRAGDSLRSIAAQVWGDSAMWYLIADANGLTGNEALTAGGSLTIPNKVTNVHNTSETFRVYNPGEAIGDITPSLPVAPPPPNSSGGCGGLAIILSAVIAVAAAVFTAGAGAVLASGGTLGTATMSQLVVAGMGALGGTFGLGVAAAAGAAGSLAGQAVALGLGMQKDISWSGVALSALGAGVAASGLGAGLSTSLGVSSTLGQSMVNAAVGSTLTQWLATATGLQNKFDWRGVAGSGLVAAAGSMIRGALSQTGMTAASIGGQLASGVMRGAVSRAGLNWAALSGEAIGTVGMAMATDDMSGVQRIATATGGDPEEQQYGVEGAIEAEARYFEALSLESGPKVDRLRLSSGADDASERNPTLVPSALQRFVNEYTGRNPHAGYEEVQGEYDRAWAAQSDARFRRQGPADLSLPQAFELPATIVTASRMTPEEAAAFDAREGATIRSIGPVEGFFAFTPTGRFFNSVGTGVGNLATGIVETGRQAVLTARDVAFSRLSWMDNAVGGNLSYTPQSVLGQRVRQRGFASTARDVVGGILTGSVEAPLGLLRGVYQRDVKLAGESLPGALITVGALRNVAGLQGPIGLKSGKVTLFENQLTNELPTELKLAKQYGISPASPGSAKFDDMVGQGTVKFVVTESGQVLVVPKYTFDGKEVSHAVINRGRPVISAGEAEISGSGSTGYFGVEILPHSGHYLNGASSSLNAAVKARAEEEFAKFGIYFKN